jgi:hypothetical protein
MIVDDDETLLRGMQEWFVAGGNEVVTFSKFEPAKGYLADARCRRAGHRRSPRRL